MAVQHKLVLNDFNEWQHDEGVQIITFNSLCTRVFPLLFPESFLALTWVSYGNLNLRELIITVYIQVNYGFDKCFPPPNSSYFTRKAGFNLYYLL